MITFYTQEEFLKEFPITDGIINCRNESFELKFNLNVEANICKAGNIKAWNINAGDIYAGSIKAWNIDALNIDAWNIKAWNIKAGNIKAENINAWNINSGNIDAWNIDAGNIDAGNIYARDINARRIYFYAVCFAYDDIVCKSIKGRRSNSKYFSLDGKIIIDGVIQELKNI